MSGLHQRVPWLTETVEFLNILQAEYNSCEQRRRGQHAYSKPFKGEILSNPIDWLA